MEAIHGLVTQRQRSSSIGVWRGIQGDEDQSTHVWYMDADAIRRLCDDAAWTTPTRNRDWLIDEMQCEECWALYWEDIRYGLGVLHMSLAPLGGEGRQWPKSIPYNETTPTGGDGMPTVTVTEFMDHFTATEGGRKSRVERHYARHCAQVNPPKNAVKPFFNNPDQSLTAAILRARDSNTFAHEFQKLQSRNDLKQKTQDRLCLLGEPFGDYCQREGAEWCPGEYVEVDINGLTVKVNLQLRLRERGNDEYLVRLWCREKPSPMLKRQAFSLVTDLAQLRGQLAAAQPIGLLSIRARVLLANPVVLSGLRGPTDIRGKIMRSAEQYVDWWELLETLPPNSRLP